MSNSSSPLTSLFYFLEAGGTQCAMLVGHGHMRQVSRLALNWHQVGRQSDYLALYLYGPEIPVNEYYEYFGPDYELDVRSSNTEDMNTPEYLERVKNIVLDNVRHLGGPPSIQMSGMDFEKL